MNLPTSEKLQQFIDGLTEAHRNYTKVAVRYIGRDDSIYEQLRHDSASIGTVIGWMRYLKESVESKNELLD